MIIIIIIIGQQQLGKLVYDEVIIAQGSAAVSLMLHV